MEYICPQCGEDEMKFWNMDIYECKECGAMIPLDVLGDINEERSR
ncbi:hypothetical protein [Amphibacillus jilinensis]